MISIEAVRVLMLIMIGLSIGGVVLVFRWSLADWSIRRKPPSEESKACSVLRMPRQ